MEIGYGTLTIFSQFYVDEQRTWVVKFMEIYTGIDIDDTNLVALNVHIVVTTVRDQGIAVGAGVEVDFTVTWNDTFNAVAEGTIVTGHDGTASFSYSGVAEGDDAIHAATTVGTL